jgi:ABC transport system ATP-binding/permease protein
VDNNLKQIFNLIQKKLDQLTTVRLFMSFILTILHSYTHTFIHSYSQGEKKRVGLSAALLKQPDVLLLDEPTNHLDIDALEWLADFLKPGGKDKDMAMLLVTHDRFFLEKVCSESKPLLLHYFCF